MKRLSALDALFLYMETPETPMHVASLTIFKPETPSDDLFARFRAHTAARLDLLPSYRRRLEPTPLGLDHPGLGGRRQAGPRLPHPPRRRCRSRAAWRNCARSSRGCTPSRSTAARPLWEYTFHRRARGRRLRRLRQGPSFHDGRARRHGDARRHLRSGARRASPRSLPQRIVPPDAEPADFIEITSTAIGDFIRQGWRAVTSLPVGRQGADEGRAELRPRRADSCTAMSRTCRGRRSTRRSPAIASTRPPRCRSPRSERSPSRAA